MKVHYINILLFALPLNILETSSSNVYTQKKPSITPHTPYTPITRLLCECELYAPANYDNDLEMKKVMQQFEDRTTQRFHEYDERMVKNRQKCKEQCDKEIQKIILKDKLEKELMDKFVTLHTDIQSDAIPTCVCEKSIEDKVEKGCLKCGYGLGGALTSWEILGYTGIYGWANFATALAKEIGIKEGIKVAIAQLEDIPGLCTLPGFKFTDVITANNYWSDSLIIKAIDAVASPICNVPRERILPFCSFSTHSSKNIVSAIKRPAEGAAELGVQKAVAVTNEKITEVTTTIGNSSNVMIASGITILIIVLIMVIIYLILRYRRKKKLKKKLQYIKLLKE
ncbi:rifin PIR protein, putative [Plasmodium reichenowi]|uniref:Rifin PIR protein, putative n=1 Tax=Plasmodium reichenowi TaxID=5854 RepID=A0A2P9DHE3_PLARE|nr:rifin PIR protein, putative [Plasmodium reichenowi]